MLLHVMPQQRAPYNRAPCNHVPALAHSPTQVEQLDTPESTYQTTFDTVAGQWSEVRLPWCARSCGGGGQGVGSVGMCTVWAGEQRGGGGGQGMQAWSAAPGSAGSWLSVESQHSSFPLRRSHFLPVKRAQSDPDGEQHA